MNRSRFFAAPAFMAGAVAIASGFQAGRPWPPGLQRVSDESPVLSPADELTRMMRGGG